MIPADLPTWLQEADPELWEKINRVHAMRYMRQIDDPQILEFLTGKEKQAIIQGYLQEAIRARGWGLQQDYVPWFHETHRCRAYISIGTQNGDLFEGIADTEAEALMRAYLSALSGERI